MTYFLQAKGLNLTIESCFGEEIKVLASARNGIENQIFLIIKDIFIEKYEENDQGWIKTLNEKILLNSEAGLENKLAFINYNYDQVLDKNILNFFHLPQKQKIFNFRLLLCILIF